MKSRAEPGRLEAVNILVCKAPRQGSVDITIVGASARTGVGSRGCIQVPAEFDESILRKEDAIIEVAVCATRSLRSHWEARDKERRANLEVVVPITLHT